MAASENITLIKEYDAIGQAISGRLVNMKRKIILMRKANNAFRDTWRIMLKRSAPLTACRPITTK